MGHTKINSIVLRYIIQRSSTGSPHDTVGPRPLETRPENLFVNLLLVTTNLFILFSPKDLGKIVIIRSVALRTSATHNTVFKTIL
jgi:hypothetical protein